MMSARAAELPDPAYEEARSRQREIAERLRSMMPRTHRSAASAEWMLRLEHAALPGGAPMRLQAAWAAQYTLMARTVRALERVMSANGIRHAWLKGPLLARRLYQAPWLRPSCDLDLLLHPEDGERFHRVALTMGWRRTGCPAASPSSDGRHGGGEWERKYLCGRNFRPPLDVKLHIRSPLRRNRIFEADGERIWNRLAWTEFEGMEYPVLDPALEYMFLAMHWHDHRYENPWWLLDLALFTRAIHSASASALGAVADEARELSCSIVVSAAISAAAPLCSVAADIPAPPHAGWRLIRRAARWALSHPRGPSLLNRRLPRLVLDVAAHDTPRLLLASLEAATGLCASARPKLSPQPDPSPDEPLPSGRPLLFRITGLEKVVVAVDGLTGETIPGLIRHLPLERLDACGCEAPEAEAGVHVVRIAPIAPPCGRGCDGMSLELPLPGRTGSPRPGGGVGAPAYFPLGGDEYLEVEGALDDETGTLRLDFRSRPQRGTAEGPASPQPARRRLLLACARSIMRHALELEGGLLLHAAALLHVESGVVIALAAPSGGGKSTAAARCLDSRPWMVLSDEYCAAYPDRNEGWKVTTLPAWGHVQTEDVRSGARFILGAVHLLEKGREDRLLPLHPSELAARLLRNDLLAPAPPAAFPSSLQEVANPMMEERLAVVSGLALSCGGGKLVFAKEGAPLPPSLLLPSGML